MMTNLGKDITDILTFINQSFPHRISSVDLIKNGIRIKISPHASIFKINCTLDFDVVMNIDRFLSEKFNLFIRFISNNTDDNNLYITAMKPSEQIKKEEFERENLKENKEIVQIEVK